jgi:hypothetical protein
LKSFKVPVMLTKTLAYRTSSLAIIVLLGCGVLLSAANDSSIHNRAQASKPFKKYLGDVRSKEDKAVFRVVVEFYTIQAAGELHGHSRVLFFTNDWEKAAEYEVDMPQHLPFKLEQNTLHFNSLLSNQELIHKQTLGNSLPRFLCVAPNDCYAKQ